MTTHEITLEHPVEIDGTRYDKLTVASLSAIANWNDANPEWIILSMSRIFDCPRRLIRHLHESDARRAGDLICNILDDYTHSVR